MTKRGQGFTDTNDYVTPDADNIVISPSGGVDYLNTHRRFALTKTVMLRNRIPRLRNSMTPSSMTMRMTRSRQHGAALIVGLVLMTVLTLLAVSTMRTSTLELSMTGNLQYREKAQQLAEAGLRAARDRINNYDIEPDTNPGQRGNWVLGIEAGPIDGTADNYRVDIVYWGIDQAPANSSEDLQAHYFELRSTGVTVARNARAIVHQGFYILVDN